MDKGIIGCLVAAIVIYGAIYKGVTDHSKVVREKRNTQEYQEYYKKCMSKMVLSEYDCDNNALNVVEGKGK